MGLEERNSLLMEAFAHVVQINPNDKTGMSFFCGFQGLEYVSTVAVGDKVAPYLAMETHLEGDVLKIDAKRTDGRWITAEIPCSAFQSQWERKVLALGVEVPTAVGQGMEGQIAFWQTALLFLRA